VPVHGGQPREHLSAASRKPQLHIAAIARRLLADGQFLAHQAVDQPHGAVVLDQQLPGEIADGHALLVRAPAKDEHRYGDSHIFFDVSLRGVSGQAARQHTCSLVTWLDRDCRPLLLGRASGKYLSGNGKRIRDCGFQ